MKCPYCKNELDTYFYPHCVRNNHYYEISHGNEMIELFDKFCFYKGKRPGIRIGIKYTAIDSFELLNNKIMEEIEALYNRLSIFE